jgi:flagellin
MALYINTNTASEAAQRNLLVNQAKLMDSFVRLSSGLRVNTAKDDAAGLGISESLKSQIRSFNVAERNAADGVSLAQTAEGALGEVHSVLGRMRELAVQAANGHYSSTDRDFMETEFSLLQAEISRIQGSAKFNGRDLVVAGSAQITLQVGLYDLSSDQITITVGGLSLSTVIGASTTIAGSTGAPARGTLATIDTAIQNVSTARSRFGATMNRLDIAQSTIQTMRLNLSAANSRIRDVDVAAETAALSRNQVLSQAGVSILAQANQLPQAAFGLIR